MARYTVLARDNTQHILHCPSCGSSDLFQHSENLMTCNKDGHTFETTQKPTLVAEQVVTKYNS